MECTSGSGRDVALTYVLCPHHRNLGVSISEVKVKGESLDLVVERRQEEGGYISRCLSQLQTRDQTTRYQVYVCKGNGQPW